MKAFFVSWCFTASPAPLEMFGDRRRDGNNGYISQQWDMLVGDGLRGLHYEMALPTHTLVFFFMLSYFGVIFVKILPK